MIWPDETGRREALLAGWQEQAGAGHVGAGTDEDRAFMADLLTTVNDPVVPGAILPRLNGSGLVLYAVADSGPAWRMLTPYLRAFIGRTVTDFDGLTAILDQVDPFERWLGEQGLAAVARIAIGADRRRSVIARSGLARLQSNLRRAELPERVFPRTTRALLGELDLALSLRDRDRAEAALSELQAGFHLDALNLRFLAVKRDAYLEDWPALYGREYFRALCDTRRPPAVTTALVEAIYRVVLAPTEHNENPGAALSVFRDQVAGQYGSLFRTLPPTPSPAVGKAFALAALSGDRPDRATLVALRDLAQAWPDDDQAALATILRLVPPVTAEPGTAAAPAFSALSVPMQIDAARDPTEPATATRAQAVLLAAYDLQTSDAYQVAAAYVGRLTPEQRQDLLSRRSCALIWAEAELYANPATSPTNWREWIICAPGMSAAQANRYAQEAAIAWPVDQQIAEEGFAEQFAAALQNPPSGAVDALEDALPMMVDWIQTDAAWPNRRLLAPYEVLFFLLVMAERRSSVHLQAARLLLDGLLTVGVSTAQYRSLLDALQDTIGEAASVHTLDWMLDVVELTIEHECRDQSARLALWSRVIEKVAPMAPRLRPRHRLMLRELGAILGAPVGLGDLTTPSAGPESEPLSLRVALYTLTESAGRRAAVILESRFPGVQVEVLDTTVSSQRLVVQARRADLFVVCWRSAAHSATDAISANRPSDNPPVYAIGKGSSSLIAAVEQELETRRLLRGRISD